MDSEQLIDNIDLKSLKPDLSFDNGYNFPSNNRITAGIIGFFFFLGLLNMLITGRIIGILFFSLTLIPILYVLASKNGVDLSTKENYYKEFISFLGKKTGKWKTAYGLTDVSILTINKTHTIGNFAAPNIKISDAETGVYLLTPSHRKRKLVSTCKSFEKADVLAKQIAKEMKKNYKTFNPQISQQTRNRR
jgi:TM2 domain-containing membrane protein YozV